MFSILDRYIGKNILSAIALTLFLLISLSGIIRFIEQLRLVRSQYDAISAGIFSLLMTPKDVDVFFPMAALLGALISLGMLASKSELVVMETAGFSRFKIALAVMKTAVPLVMLSMLIGEWVAPVTEQVARNLRSEKIYGNSLLAERGSIWTKNGDEYIYIGKINSDGSIENINIYATEQNRLLSITHAAYGIYENNHWTLSQVETKNLQQHHTVVGVNRISMHWNSTITPDKLTLVAFNPESLSAIKLHQYSRYLKSSGQDTQYYDLLFWKKMFKPISVAVMMLLALSFIFGPLRSVSMGLRIVIGISFGFIFYISDNVFAQLSIVIGLYPFFGALLTSLVFLSISYGLFSKKN